jgi:hypothetical protein
VTAPAAFAVRPVLPDDGPAASTRPVTDHPIATWEIALIALAAVIVTVAVTATLVRLRSRWVLHPAAG